MTFDPKKILAEVRANTARLESCKRHEFSGDESRVRGVCRDGAKLYDRYVCSACGGSVDMHARYWYERGLQHGGAP